LFKGKLSEAKKDRSNQKNMGGKGLGSSGGVGVFFFVWCFYGFVFVVKAGKEGKRSTSNKTKRQSS